MAAPDSVAAPDGAADQDVVVAADMAVTIAFELYDERSECVESVTSANPIVYVHGYAQLLPGLEAALEGCEAGECFTVEVPPEEAFGVRNEQATLEIDRHDFPGGETVVVGDEVIAERGDGAEALHRVVAVDADTIMVDLNHPLAGQRIQFAVEVCEVRPATDEELDAARADIDDRIDSAGAIVYESDPNGTASYPRWSLGMPDPSESAPLVQLRRNPSSDEESHE